jgi:tetratricopeptide (TPR) repeat protein
VKNMRRIAIVMVIAGVAHTASGQDVVQVALEEAITIYERGEFDRAGDRLRKILRLRPKNAVAHYYLARTHWEAPQQNLTLAIGHYQAAIHHGIDFTGRIVPLTLLDEVAPASHGDLRPTETEAEVESALPEKITEGGEVPFPAEEASLATSTPPGEFDLPDLLESGTEMGRIQDKKGRLGEDALTHSETLKDHVFWSGIQMCAILIDRRDLDRAREYADDVTLVAPDHWAGYYLLAKLFLEDEDMVEARNSWETAVRRGFLVSSGFPDISSEFREPEELLDHYISLAKAQIQDAQRAAADATLMRTQDIADLDFTQEQILEKIALVDCMLGKIALAMEDFEGAIESLERAEFVPNSPCSDDGSMALAQAGRDSLALIPVERSWIEVRPMQYQGNQGEPGTIRLRLGKSYYSARATHLMGEGRDEMAARADTSAPDYLVEGGGAYRVDFDLRRQVLSAAGHGVTALVLLTLLLAL